MRILLALALVFVGTCTHAADRRPKITDGQSLRPLLEGKTVGLRDDFFYEHHYHARGSKERTIPRTKGVRTEQWKYITSIDEN